MNTEALTTPLSVDEIEFRVQSVNKGGYATLLAYKNARTDMDRLDKAYGVGNWEREHQVIDGMLFCTVTVPVGEGLTSSVQDVGAVSPSNNASEDVRIKALVSDSFKRACVNLGIGRDLYSYPNMSVKLKAHEWDKERGRPSFKFKLAEWAWFNEFDDDGHLTKLVGMDETGEKRYGWDGKAVPAPAAVGEPLSDDLLEEVRKARANLFNACFAEERTKFNERLDAYVGKRDEAGILKAVAYINTELTKRTGIK